MKGFINETIVQKIRRIAERELDKNRRHAKAKWCFSGRYVAEADDMIGSQDWRVRASGIGEYVDVGTELWCTAKENLVRRFESSEWGRGVGTSLTILEHEEEALRYVDRKIDRLLGVTPEYAAPAQLLVYPTGSEYGEHVDCHATDEDEQNDPPSNQRVVSAIVYLSQDGTGGETVFPHLAFQEKKELAVTPSLGSLLLWTSLDLRPADGVAFCLKNSTHRSNPVQVGEKVAYQKWYHVAPGAVAESGLSEATGMIRAALSAGMKRSEIPELRDRTVFCEGEVGSCRDFSVLMFPRKRKRSREL